MRLAGIIRSRGFIVKAAVSAVLSPLTALCAQLFVANISQLAARLAGDDVGAIFAQLSDAGFRWSAVALILCFVLMFAALTPLVKSVAAKKPFPAVLSALLALVAAVICFAVQLLMLRVNDVPVYIAISVIIKLINGGLL